MPAATVLTDLRAAPQPLLGEVLALNASHETETSPLAAGELASMIGEAFFARAATDRASGALLGFLLAFTAGARYASPNFLWFRDRLNGFAYVDRVITAPEARGSGVAGGLYGALFAEAEAARLATIACEVNLEPPNPASDAFHAALGFREMGRLTRGAKTVRYLVRGLAEPGR